MSTSSLEVYIQQPPLRRKIDRAVRFCWYMFTFGWAVLALFNPVAEATALPHGEGWDVLASAVLGLASLIGAVAAIRSNRMLELGASPFVVAGLLPFCLGAAVDMDPALALATASLICANLARGNTLRTAVMRASTMKDIEQYDGSNNR